ncbi:MULTISPECIES: hypothetical protein [Frankia]|nr:MULTISPECIES: hypothetical protein [Frankia]
MLDVVAEPNTAGPPARARRAIQENTLVKLLGAACPEIRLVPRRRNRG